MAYMILKILVLLKSTRTLKRFLRGKLDFYFLKNNFFSQHIRMENPSPKEENIVKDVRNIFRLEKLKKEAIDIKIKDTRNLFRLEKRIKQLETKYLNRFLEWKKIKKLKI